MSHVTVLMDRIFIECAQSDIDGVISRLTSVHPDAGAARESFEYQMRGVGAIAGTAKVSLEFSEELVGSVQQMLFAAINADNSEEKEYAFDCKLTAALRVKAKSQKEAEAIIRGVLDAANCNAGCWPDGSPVLFEASLDGELSLFEVDGEPAPTEDDVVNIINKLSREAAIDILDEHLGVSCCDEKDDDAVRSEVLSAYTAGKIDGSTIVEES